MKTLFKTVCFSALTLSAALLLTQCAGHRAETVRAAKSASPTATGNVTLQTLGDTTVATRRLIHHPLTNKDIGKVYEEITIVSPRGTSVEDRVIVRALPKLETNVVTR